MSCVIFAELIQLGFLLRGKNKVNMQKNNTREETTEMVKYFDRKLSTIINKKKSSIKWYYVDCITATVKSWQFVSGACMCLSICLFEFSILKWRVCVLESIKKREKYFKCDLYVACHMMWKNCSWYLNKNFFSRFLWFWFEWYVNPLELFFHIIHHSMK